MTDTPVQMTTDTRELERLIAELQQSKADLEARRFVESSLARFAHIIRYQNEDTLQTWADRILEELTAAVGGLQASMYISRDAEDLALSHEGKNKIRLDLAGTYAFDRNTLDKVIDLESGIIGQVAKSRRSYYFDDPSAFESRTYTSLVQLTPGCLLISPMVFNDELQGVLEISGVRRFSEQELELLRSLCENIAANIMTVRGQERMKRLYAETQKKAQELLTQEEEMRQNVEELEATQEEMKRVNAELDGRVNAINRSNAVIEFSLDGTILTANDNFLKITGYSLDEIKGKHHAMFVDKDYAETVEYKQFWPKLASGEINQGEFRRIKKNGETFWIRATYAPINGTDGKPYKILKIASDFTDYKQQEQVIQQALDEALAKEKEVRKLQEQFQAEAERATTLFENAGDAILLLDETGCIDCNRAALTLFCAKTKAELIGKTPVDFSPPTQANGIESATLAAQYIEATMTKGHTTFDWLTKTFDDTIIDTAVSLTKIEIQGKAILHVLLRDISAIKQAEAKILQARTELEEYKNFMESAVNSSDTMFIATDTQGTIKYWNTAAQRYLGYTADEILDKLTPASFHEIDEIVAEAARLSAEYGETVEPGFGVFTYLPFKDIPYSREWTYVHKDGTRFPVQLNISAWKNTNGEFGGLLGVARDITQEKLQQTALAQIKQEIELQRNQLQSLIDCVQDATIVAVDTNLIITQFNEPFRQQYLAAGIDIYIGKPLLEIVPENEMEKIVNLWNRAFSGESFTDEIHYINEAINLEAYYELNYSPILNAQKEIIGGALFARDVTTRRKQEILIQNNEKLLNTIIDNLPVALFAKDVNAGYTFSIVNRQFTEITGLSRDAALGKSDFDFFPPEQATAFRQADEQVMAGAVPVHYPNEPVRSATTGQDILVAATKVPIKNEKGEPMLLLGIMEDVTDKVRAQEALIDNEARLQEAMALANMGAWVMKLPPPEQLPGVLNGEVPAMIELDDNLVHMLNFDPNSKDSNKITSADFIANHVHPDDMPAITLSFNNLFASGNNGTAQYQARYRGVGQQWWQALVTLKLTTDANGIPLSVTGTTQNINEVYTATQKIQEAQKRFDTALQVGKIGMWDWDLITNHVVYSNSWKRILGYEPNELEDTLETFQKLVHPDDGAQAFELIDRYLKGEAPAYEIEFRMHHKSGSWRKHFSLGQVFRDDDGNPIRIIGMQYDITDRSQLNELLGTALQNFGTAVITTDAEGFITYADDLTTGVLGYFNAELVGNHIGRLLAPEDQATLWTTMENEVNTVGFAQATLNHIHRNNKIVPLNHARAVVKDLDGKTTGYVSFLRRDDKETPKTPKKK